MMASMAFVAMLVFSVALVAGFFGTLHPAFDSFAHFRVHLAVLMALCALPLLATSFRLQAATGLLFAVAAFATTSNALSVPRLWPVQAAYEVEAGDQAVYPGDQAVYRLLQMNLRFNNSTPEKVLSLIGRTQPDVITLDEVSDMWKAKLGHVASAYPYRIFCPYPNGVFGVALLSRRSFAAGAQPRCYGRGAMAIATVDFGGTEVDVAAMHLTWPWPRNQSRQIGGLSGEFASLGETSIMACDCNAAPWSAAVRRVAGLGKLTVAPSPGPTWLPIKLPEFLRFAGLPIDLVFSKGAVLIHSVSRLENTGSDHLPLMVEFSLRQEQKKPVDEQETATASVRQNGRTRG
ncbi:endonuclease/exonuclease/phosphatase [Mesorhizobium sp. L48C026A00]|nr:endonuclease/exonuclease/phosphatase family protein [Mesorhizobium sp.]ESZ17989.1 endonuclease/exonuclease/phosphatase [Mesorhizobium sp. L48C026A00]RWN56219.1 MAG: AP endonuclease [Mesorhizobium sp.]RWN76787.1 MAG: AP endonuclease [Mesorhizobium sp.]RWN81598.1 MAG: AP endonuclease [Mesorhizobium sp.]RWN90594.1 MAG: AP endonuclease [Mesorhizobium sp.]